MKKDTISRLPEVRFKQIDYWALAGSVLNLMVSLFIAYDIMYPDEAFTAYWSNGGVRASGIGGFVLSLLVTGGFIWFAVKRELSERMFHALLFGVVLACALMWFDLWWGSTFYYGEVRDKQGLGFPWRSLAGLVYVVWRIRVPSRFDTSAWKGCAAVVLTLSLWGLWELVYESWNLWQS